MAGTTVVVKRQWAVKTVPPGGVDEALRQFYNQINNIVTDLENLRFGARYAERYRVEDLAAGADITERAFFRASDALVISNVLAIHEAASAGIDGSNTAVITLRNITQAEDVATITLTADVSANGVTVLTLVNPSITALDVLGVVVTQGTTADLAAFNLQFNFRKNSLNTASNLVAAALSSIEPGD